MSSVGRARDYRAGGRGFDSRGRTNTEGLKITEKLKYYLRLDPPLTRMATSNGGPDASRRLKNSLSN